MNKFWLIFLIILPLNNCRPQVNEEPETPPPTIVSLSGQPIPVALSELAANPSIFEGAFIQLTGQYTKLPLLVCQSNAQPSPATWGLSSDTLVALVGGFDEQLRPLLPNNLTMTIAGRWQHWEGMVGCGDTAQSQEVWYLAVSRIVSPSPITQATLTPVGSLIAQEDGSPPDAEETEIAPTAPGELPGPEDSPTPPPVGGSTEVPINPIATPTAGLFINTATPLANATNTRTVPTETAATATPTVIGGVSPTNTPPPNSTSTPTLTPLPGTTPTSGPPSTSSPTPSSTPDLDNVEMGNLNPDSLEMDFLDTGEKHIWLFYNEISNNYLTLRAIAVDSVDLIIVVIDPTGAALVLENSMPAGQVEVVTELDIPREGDYQVIIYAANGAIGDYALLAQDSLSTPIEFNKIDYNATVTANYDTDTELLWFFTGNEQDIVTITAVPDANADIDFEFFGPDNEFLEYVYEGVAGETEILADYPLPASGLFGIWLFGESDSSITTDLTVTAN